VRNDLTYVATEDGRFQAAFNVTVDAIVDDEVVDSRSWNNVNTADSLAAIAEGHQLFTLTYFDLEAGEYTLRYNIKDLNSELSETMQFNLAVGAYPDTVLSISDIQFATQITADTANTQFTKNGFRVLPNPSGMYGTVLPMLYFYVEVYNLLYEASEEPTEYTIKYLVLDGNGQKVKEWPVRKKMKPGSSAVEVGGVNIISIRSGTYHFIVEVTDLENDVITYAQKKFYIFREGEDFDIAPQQKVASNEGSPGLDADRYDVASEKELDDEFEPTKYFNEPEERRIWKSLKLEEKREFIRNFWAKRDPTPGTEENEFKRAYLSRIEAANSVFKGFSSGWKTDRGRILLQYGTPDEIERFPFSIDVNEYHVWHFYAIQGGVQFIFVRKHESGPLELVHSTAQGELFDTQWQRWLIRGN
jgi:GWxTD domain-containing protein